MQSWRSGHAEKRKKKPKKLKRWKFSNKSKELFLPTSCLLQWHPATDPRLARKAIQLSRVKLIALTTTNHRRAKALATNQIMTPRREIAPGNCTRLVLGMDFTYQRVGLKTWKPKICKYKYCQLVCFVRLLKILLLECYVRLFIYHFNEKVFFCVYKHQRRNQMHEKKAIICTLESRIERSFCPKKWRKIAGLDLRLDCKH